MRARSMIQCHFISDASVVPVHWQYNKDVIQKSVSEDGNPLLFSTEEKHWINPFYKVEVGNNSLYADQGRALLESLSRNPSFDCVDYSKTLENYFTKDNGLYGEFPEKDVTRDDYPVLRGWRPHSIKSFLSSIRTKKEECKNIDEEKIYLFSGSSDEQSDCLAKVTPFVALDFQKNSNGKISMETLQNIDKCVSVTQTGPKAIATALVTARILCYCLQEENTNERNHRDILVSVLRKVMDDLEDENRVYPYALDGDASNAIKDALSNKDRDHIEFVSENGQGCGLFFNFVNALHCVLQFGTLQSALKQTILAGGDCAARSLFIGAVFGSLYSLDNERVDIPDSWKKLHLHWNSISEQVDILLSDKIQQKL